jgi:hypothetical protein
MATVDAVAAEVEQVVRELGVDPARGLSADDARSRLASHGPKLVELVLRHSDRVPA